MHAGTPPRDTKPHVNGHPRSPKPHQPAKLRPDEQVPIPDLRTVGDRGVRRPRPDLLDTIYQCQQRQDWYRDYARGIGLDPVSCVGSLTLYADAFQMLGLKKLATFNGMGERLGVL